MSNSMDMQKPGSESSRYMEKNQVQNQEKTYNIEHDLSGRYKHSNSANKIADSRFSRLGTQSLVIPQIGAK